MTAVTEEERRQKGCNPGSWLSHFLSFLWAKTIPFEEKTPGGLISDMNIVCTAHDFFFYRCTPIEKPHINDLL